MEDTQLRLAEYLKVDSLNDIVLIQKSNRAPVQFSAIYTLHSILGAGSFGIVCRVTHIESGRNMALKIAALNELHPSTAALALMHEHRMLTEQLSHANIISVIPSEESYFNYFIMQMELGLETLGQLQSRMQLTEEISAKIMRGVFSALDYLHNDKNVIHRDVKPENIVIMDYEHYTVKLIDFGLAVKATKQGIKDFAHCGTLLYTPPEQVLNLFAYAKKADMWAAGIITFQLVYGKHPLEEATFSKASMEERLKNFISVTFPPDEVSFQAKHLISYLLQKSVSARFSPEAALSHPWITRELDADLPLTRNQQLELQSKRFELIDRFRKTINTLYFCSVTLCSQISESTQDSSHTLRSYKRVLIDQHECSSGQSPENKIEIHVGSFEHVALQAESMIKQSQEFSKSQNKSLVGANSRSKPPLTHKRKIDLAEQHNFEYADLAQLKTFERMEELGEERLRSNSSKYLRVSNKMNLKKKKNSNKELSSGSGSNQNINKFASDLSQGDNYEIASLEPRKRNVKVSSAGNNPKDVAITLLDSSYPQEPQSAVIRQPLPLQNSVKHRNFEHQTVGARSKTNNPNKSNLPIIAVLKQPPQIKLTSKPSSHLSLNDKSESQEQDTTRLTTVSNNANDPAKNTNLVQSMLIGYQHQAIKEKSRQPLSSVNRKKVFQYKINGIEPRPEPPNLEGIINFKKVAPESSQFISPLKVGRMDSDNDNRDNSLRMLKMPLMQSDFKIREIATRKRL